MPIDSASETTQRLMDASERLFAENGMSRTSLREITREAGANIAAVNYHFGSKEALVREVFARRMNSLNAARIRMLDELLAAAAPAAASLEDVLLAFVGPTLEFGRRRPEAFRLFQRFHLETREFREQCMGPELFREVMERFRAALVAALPGAPIVDQLWGMQFMLGSMIHIASIGEELERLSGGAMHPLSEEELVKRIIDYSAAGFRAMGEDR